MRSTTATATKPRRGENYLPRVSILASDRQLARRIASALSDDGLEVLGSADDIPQLIAAAGEQPLDAVIVDCTGASPRKTAATLRKLRQFFEPARLVVVPTENSGQAVSAAFRSFADAVVYPSRVEDALAPSVRAVLAEQVVFPRDDLRRVKRPALSFRERQVLRLVIDGCTNSQIATALFLAESTVKSHLTSAFAKLAVNSRSEAAALLLDPDEPLGRALAPIAAVADRRDRASR